jgi:hypothetical protein
MLATHAKITKKAQNNKKIGALVLKKAQRLQRWELSCFTINPETSRLGT